MFIPLCISFDLDQIHLSEEKGNKKTAPYVGFGNELFVYHIIALFRELTHDAQALSIREAPSGVVWNISGSQM